MISGLVLDGRGNVIDGAGTGMYVGNSKGTDAFVGDLIEYSLTTVSKPVDVYSDMIETARTLAKRLF